MTVKTFLISCGSANALKSAVTIWMIYLGRGATFLGDKFLGNVSALSCSNAAAHQNLSFRIMLMTNINLEWLTFCFASHLAGILQLIWGNTPANIEEQPIKEVSLVPLIWRLYLVLPWQSEQRQRLNGSFSANLPQI